MSPKQKHRARQWRFQGKQSCVKAAQYDRNDYMACERHPNSRIMQQKRGLVCSRGVCTTAKWCHNASKNATDWGKAFGLPWVRQAGIIAANQLAS